MAYSDPTAYAKYLKHKASGCGCSNKEDSSDDECSCCPPGLVQVLDIAGKPAGCLTPEDAAAYNAALPCAAGFSKLYRNAADPPEFLGCVPSDDFAELYALVNPVA